MRDVSDTNLVSDEAYVYFFKIKYGVCTLKYLLNVFKHYKWFKY